MVDFVLMDTVVNYSSCQIAIIGTGIVGIATAYYLAKHHKVTDIVLIDRSQPMNFTSGASPQYQSPVDPDYQALTVWDDA